MRILLPALALVLLAQPGSSQSRDAVDLFKPAEVKLPKGNGSWTVRVIRSGTVTGSTSLDITVSSLGTVTCLIPTEPLCPPSLDSVQLQPLTEIATKEITKSTSGLTAPCSDCVVTRVTLQHRDSRGKVRKEYAYWKGLAGSAISADLADLAQRVASLVR